MFVAISSGLYSLVETLLQSGADVSVVDQVGILASLLVFISYSELTVSFHFFF